MDVARTSSGSLPPGSLRRSGPSSVLTDAIALASRTPASREDARPAAGLRRVAVWAVAVGALALAGCQQLPTAGIGRDGRAPEAPGSRTDGAIPSVVSTMKSRAQPAPSWMVGSFSGRSLRTGLQNVDLDVQADGSLRGRIGDLQAQGQYIGASRILWAHGNESIVERRDNGFRVTQVRDPANVIEYQRR